MKKKCFFPSAFLFVAVFLAADWPPQLSFRLYSDKNGLSQNTLNCMLQDRQGFMWFGTQDGLNQFDGYQFKVYRHEPDDPNSIIHNRIYAIIEDRSGNLWIGTAYGLSLYERARDRFVNFVHDPKNSKSLSADWVQSLAMDRSGNIWVGTWDGLCLYDPLRREFSRFDHDPSHPGSLAGNFIRCLFADRQGRLWIGTDQNGLDRLDSGTRTFKHYRHLEGNLSSLSQDKIQCIAEDRAGQVWIGTPGGLNRYDAGADAFVSFRHDPGDSKSLSSNLVTSLCRGVSTDLWVGTANGLNAFESGPQRFFHYYNNPDIPDSLNHNEVSSIFEDAKGLLWVGSWTGGGINLHSPDKARFSLYQHIRQNPDSLGFNNVFGLYEDLHGGIWIATLGKGMDRLDRNSGRFQHYNLNLKNLPSNDVWRVREDRKGNMWIATDQEGLYVLDRGHDRFRHFRHQVGDQKSLRDNKVWHIYEDREGRIWIGTNVGLHLFNPATSDFTSFLPFPNRESHALNVVRCLLEDERGDFWVGTQGGLARFDRKRSEFTRYSKNNADPRSISDNEVRCLFQDVAGSLWIGTSNGLNRLERQTMSFIHYTQKNGLPNNTIYGILQDRNGFLWLSTNKGLCRLDPRSLACQNFNRSDGLQSDEFNSESYLLTRDGEMFFGGVNGLNSFFPDRIKENKDVPKVIITGFQLFNRPVPIGRDSGGREILTAPISETKKIVLSYRDYIFSLEFVALHFGANEKIQYAYRMEGLEKNWNYIGDRRYSAYSTLPPGHYTFQVRASNNDGRWSDEYTSLAIVIRPPFWKTWWFYFFCGGAFLSAIFILYRFRVNQLTRKKEELEKLVALRTRELKDMSLKDPLTGLRNRRFITEILSEDIGAFLKKKMYLIKHQNNRRQRNDLNVYGVLMIDIDHFKLINDHFGHEIGDRWLRQLADAMKASVRADDEVIRLGGEEFLVVLRNMDPDLLQEFASSFRQKLINLELCRENHELRHTTSIGIASFPFYEKSPDLLGFDEVIILADMGLYHAKKSGRDMCVHVVPGNQIPLAEDISLMLTSPTFGVESEHFSFVTSV